MLSRGWVWAGASGFGKAQCAHTANGDQYDGLIDPQPQNKSLTFSHTIFAIPYFYKGGFLRCLPVKIIPFLLWRVTNGDSLPLHLFFLLVNTCGMNVRLFDAPVIHHGQ